MRHRAASALVVLVVVASTIGGCAHESIVRAGRFPAPVKQALENVRPILVGEWTKAGIKPRGGGTAFPVRGADGEIYLVTAAHVVADSCDAALVVRPIGLAREVPRSHLVPLEPVHLDVLNDLAILRPTSPLALQALGLRNSVGAQASLGDDAYVAGYPFLPMLGYAPTWLATSISAVRPPNTPASVPVAYPPLSTIYQLPNALGPGMSGGPIVDRDGVAFAVAARTIPDASLGMGISLRPTAAILAAPSRIASSALRFRNACRKTRMTYDVQYDEAWEQLRKNSYRLRQQFLDQEFPDSTQRYFKVDLPARSKVVVLFRSVAPINTDTSYLRLLQVVRDVGSDPVFRRLSMGHLFVASFETDVMHRDQVDIVVGGPPGGKFSLVVMARRHTEEGTRAR